MYLGNACACLSCDVEVWGGSVWGRVFFASKSRHKLASLRGETFELESFGLRPKV